MDNTSIVVRGAREHNLRNVSLELPRDALICFTGVSGSGKSSLAFDTLYAEGQRRYVESLSSYARQFLGQLSKPDVDYIGGLSPAVSIQQKTATRNPRSTVGTVTEISDFLRVLFARVGQGHCPNCQRPITAQTREQIIGRVLALPTGTPFLILAPMVRGQKGEFKDFFADMLKRGYVRARVDGQIVRLNDELRLDRRIKHDIAIVIDRLKADAKSRTRLAEAVDSALTLADGNLIVSVEAPDEAEKTGSEDILLSAHYACTHCGLSYEPPSPQMFSFNSPQGMCPACDGLGSQFTFDPELMIPDPSLSMYKGAIPLVGPIKGMGKWRKHIYEGVAKAFDIDLNQSWGDLPEEHRHVLLHGGGDRHITYEWKQRGGAVWKHGGKWEGVIPQMMASFRKVAAGPRRMQLEKYMRVLHCSVCDGQRLNPQARAVRVGGNTLIELGGLPIGDLVPWFDGFEKDLKPVQKIIAGELLKEIRTRLGFLLNVGLHYLTLDRSAPSLSGGEAQRIRLASQIGSGLVGVLYILDEPSIGLHPRDNERLLRSLQDLRDMGNTVLVVEHDEETMREADYLVDFGPGPGVKGGEVVAAGRPADVLRNKNSLTGQYLSGKKKIEIPKRRRETNGKALTVIGARHHNLRNIDVELPLGVFLCVTGVSGSGKSSLINDILLEGLRHTLKNGGGRGEEEEFPHELGEHDRIEGTEHIDKVIAIDQSPIGRTPRSNPATYIKVLDEIRTLYALMPEAKVRGYQRGRFSFNREGGRCESCEGNGSNRLEMDFLADVWVTCPVCEGRRFNRETLQVRYRGKNIHDVLEMDVQEALELFEHAPKIRPMLETLHRVGLDYIKLGQPSPTLSGGEAQRVKLARELCKRSTGKTLYILDEPTTGLHFEDIRKLLEVLHGFVESGNNVLVIEHNLDVIKTADWVIDLGPEGGSGGGMVVAAGTPEAIAECKESFTGQALSPVLHPKKGRAASNGKVGKKPSRNGDRITHLTVEGAREHNLKDVTAKLPREKMTVFCGPSGSGKSSLALDTIYAEGQRRYVESLSSYARQFLGQVQKPKVEHITGLSPAISIEQKTTSKSPRSTVGTITEIYDYLRILFARLGQRYCPACRMQIGTQSSDEIVDKILGLTEGTKLYLMAPVERRGQERYEAIWDELRRSGFSRVRVNGKSHSLEEPPAIDHRRKHDVEVIVDRNVVRHDKRGRIAESVETALSFGRGVMRIAYVDDGREEHLWKVETYSQHLACNSCGRSYDDLTPHQYSFNSPLGWCPACEGLGVQRGANLNVLIRDESKSLSEGAIAAWPDLEPGTPFTQFVEAIAGHLGFSLDTPYRELEPAVQRAILHGTGEVWIDGAGVKFQYKGLFPALDEASRVSFAFRARLSHLVDEVPCSTCQGSRLRSDSAATRFMDRTLGDLSGLPLGETLAMFKGLKLAKRESEIAGELLREITSRLQFLVDVGLEYLALSRPGPTLSGGEAQRIRLASQIGSGLTGVLYVLDEPTIGLHPRDNARLLGALQRLRDLGNTMILVEHDREVIDAADHLLDFGPGAGDTGGEITAAGTPKQVRRSKSSLTGKYLSGKEAIAVPTNRRVATLTPLPPRTGGGDQSAPPRRVTADGFALNWLSVIGARQHNLQNVNAHIPLGCLVAVTGVSGSGKSTLIHEVLYSTLARKLHRAQTSPAAHDEIRGVSQIDKIINVDQNPIGNAPSSNPATYSGVFDLIRQLYSQLPESKVRGYPAKRFSFNQPGGRCEACEGNGQVKIEMHFLPDVWVECDTCHGKRYNPETLAVRYHEKSIAEVLDLRISEALELFGNIPKIRHILQTLVDVGLGYLSLGQSAPTLSGGEAQRVKLAAELARPSTGKTLYLLDEPTTGLHFDDIRKLLGVLHRLADLGNTVVVVEHNLDVIKTADWLIDLGPEAGSGGGTVVAAGTPEEVVRDAKSASHTARILADILKSGPHEARPIFDPRAAAIERIDDISLEQVGSDAALPWEEDGRKWHTQDRVTPNGKPVRWDGDILNYIDREVHKLGDFSETNWNHRSVIEIASAKKSLGWFLHMMTGQVQWIRLVFRVSRNTFKQEALTRELGIEPLDVQGLEQYAGERRVHVANRKGPWQDAIIQAHSLADVDTPAFRKFLKRCVEAFDKTITRMRTTPEDVMPWKLNGERWHLGDKGFPPRRRVRWEKECLPRLLDLCRGTEQDLNVIWEARDTISLKLSGMSRAWGRIRTKDPDALDCRFAGPAGQFNLSQVDGIADEVELIDDSSNHGQVLRLKIRTGFNGQRLKSIVTEQMSALKEGTRRVPSPEAIPPDEHLTPNGEHSVRLASRGGDS